MRRTANLKINKIPHKKKEKVKSEIIVNCDGCGKSLNRTCVRNANSAICATSVGLKTKCVGTRWEFYHPQCFVN